MDFDFAEFRQFLETHPDMTYIVQSKCHCPAAIWLANKLNKQVEVDDVNIRLDGVNYPTPMWMRVYIRRFDKLGLSCTRRPASEAVEVANQFVRDWM